ncbi:MAG: hypothetical protein VX984_01245 [Thermodesulfobacteriota bacterium]|nr:hypothetical protein [Thermodesulfobacteriota bacterium]
MSIIESPNENEIEKIIKLITLLKKKSPNKNINITRATISIKKLSKNVNNIFDKHSTDKSKGILIRISSPCEVTSCLDIL